MGKNIEKGLAEAVTRACTAAINTTDNVVEAACMGMAAGLAAAGTIATVLGNPFPKGQTDGEKDINNAVTSESLRFATLLMMTSGRVEGEADEAGIGCDYGPHSIIKAMRAYETIFGEKPDAYLQPKLVEAMRQFQLDHAGMDLEEVAKAHHERQGAVLN